MGLSLPLTDWIKPNRDIGVELLRIIACIIVIGTHVKLTDLPTSLPGHEIDISRTIIGGFLGEGVTVFFFIMGFYLFKGTSFKKRLAGTIKSIIVPAFIYVVTAQLLSLWITGTTGLADSITHADFAINTFSGIFSWNAAAIPWGNHLWYLFTYVQIILWFPVLSLFCAQNQKANTIRRYLLAMAGIATILSDIQQIIHFDWGYTTWYSILPNAVFIVLLGYEIFQVRTQCLGNKKILVAGLLLYLIIHFILSYFQILLYKRDYTTGHVFSWDSSFAILGATGLTLFSFSINFRSNFAKKTITYLGANTFYIYLIHMLIIGKLSSCGFSNLLYSNCGNSAIGNIIYTIIYTLLVFIISLVLSTAIEIIKSCILNVAHNLSLKRDVS